MSDVKTLAVPKINRAAAMFGARNKDFPREEEIPRLETPFTLSAGMNIAAGTKKFGSLTDKSGDLFFYFDPVLLKLKDGLDQKAVTAAIQSYLTTRTISVQYKAALLMWALWSWFDVVKTDFDPDTISDPAAV